MRKIIVFILTMALIVAMSVTAFAVTPKWEYKAVKLPEIKFTSVENIVSNWFKEHPLNIKIDFTNVKLG